MLRKIVECYLELVHPAHDSILSVFVVRIKIDVEQ